MKRSLSAVLACALLTWPAHAQAPVSPAPATAAVPLPKPNAAPAPEAELKTPPVESGYFPPLPPANSCKKKDIVGLWRVERTYESPPGAELANFSSQPFQFIFFSKEYNYRRYSASINPATPQEVLDKMKAQTDSYADQYIMHESGIVFFYKNSANDGSRACFIVAQPRGPFAAGEMLLMEPLRADGSLPPVKMLKAYKKIWNFPAPKPPPRRVHRVRRHR